MARVFFCLIGGEYMKTFEISIFFGQMHGALCDLGEAKPAMQYAKAWLPIYLA